MLKMSWCQCGGQLTPILNLHHIDSTQPAHYVCTSIKTENFLSWENPKLDLLVLSLLVSEPPVDFIYSGGFPCVIAQFSSTYTKNFSLFAARRSNSFESSICHHIRVDGQAETFIQIYR